MATQLATIQMKRGNADEWSNTKGILAEGEWGLNTTTGEVKMGDGTSLWSDLPVTLLADAGGQLPDVVRGALAQNLSDPATPEGAALAEVIANSGGGGSATPLTYDPATGAYSVPAGSSITYDASTGAYSSN